MLSVHSPPNKEYYVLCYYNVCMSYYILCYYKYLFSIALQIFYILILFVGHNYFSWNIILLDCDRGQQFFDNTSLRGNWTRRVPMLTLHSPPKRVFLWQNIFMLLRMTKTLIQKTIVSYPIIMYVCFIMVYAIIWVLTFHRPWNLLHPYSCHGS